MVRRRREKSGGTCFFLFKSAFVFVVGMMMFATVAAAHSTSYDSEDGLYVTYSVPIDPYDRFYVERYNANTDTWQRAGTSLYYPNGCGTAGCSMSASAGRKWQQAKSWTGDYRVVFLDYDAADNLLGETVVAVPAYTGGGSPSPTPTPTPTLPMPGNFSVAPYSESGATLHWNGVSGATEYNVFIDGVWSGFTTAPTTTMHFPEGIEPGEHTFTVVAKDDEGGQSAPATYTTTIGSGGGSPTPSPTPTPAPTSPPATADDIAACADQICQCIRELLPALGQIAASTDGLLDAVTGQIVPALAGLQQTMTQQLGVTTQIRDDLRSVLAELRTTQNYQTKSVTDYVIPSIEDHKPPMPTAYQDDRVYFEDQGDAAPPPALPVAPEPTNQWTMPDGTVIEREPQPSRDPVMSRDPVLQRATPPPRDTTVYERRWRMQDGVIVD